MVANHRVAPAIFFGIMLIRLVSTCGGIKHMPCHLANVPPGWSKFSNPQLAFRGTSKRQGRRTLSF